MTKEYFMVVRVDENPQQEAAYFLPTQMNSYHEVSTEDLYLTEAAAQEGINKRVLLLQQQVNLYLPHEPDYEWVVSERDKAKKSRIVKVQMTITVTE